MLNTVIGFKTHLLRNYTQCCKKDNRLLKQMLYQIIDFAIFCFIYRYKHKLLQIISHSIILTLNEKLQELLESKSVTLKSTYWLVLTCNIFLKNKKRHQNGILHQNNTHSHMILSPAEQYTTIFLDSYWTKLNKKEEQ